MSNTRDAILSRLRQHKAPASEFSARNHVARFDWSKAEKISRLSERMTAVHAEIHRCNKSNWIEVFAAICRDKAVANLLLSPATEAGKQIWSQASLFPELLEYDREIEQWKAELFNQVSAGFTTTLGGIAETGSLILWPDQQEPRLLSLVPPVHIALLDAERIYSTFAEAIEENHWAEQGMPTNALLISGPSKSADIEQTLAYGVHGPRELVVILLE